MLHGDYKDVKSIGSTNACRDYIKISDELTKFKASPEIKAALDLIRKADAQKKKLKDVILNDLKGIDRLKFEVTVTAQHRDACDFSVIKVVKTTVKDILKDKEAKIS